MVQLLVDFHLGVIIYFTEMFVEEEVVFWRHKFDFDTLVIDFIFTLKYELRDRLYIL